MDGHARLSGKLHKTIAIGGKSITLSKPTLVGVYAEMEAFVISRKRDPLVLAVEACKTAPPAHHAAIWEAAMKTASAARIATAEEMAAFERSPWGIAFKLWKCLDDRHLVEFPTPEATMGLIESLRRQPGRSAGAACGRKRRGRPGKLIWPEPDSSGGKASDGHPAFGGWPAVYKFFADSYGWTIEETDGTPLYTACILLGAISPDHKDVRLSPRDMMRYHGKTNPAIRRLFGGRK